MFCFQYSLNKLTRFNIVAYVRKCILSFSNYKITTYESLCSVTQQEGKATICATVPEAETQIVSLLQGKFLELLGRFRYYKLCYSNLVEALK